jgi:plasmid stabilization system protein ParE
VTFAAFHPSAVLEFRAAADYYDDGVQGLGDQFIDEVERVVTLLCEHPQLGSSVDAIHRRIFLRRFPFALIYRLHIRFEPDHAFASG